VPAESEFDYDSFILLKRIVVKDMVGFDKVCMQFYFKQGDSSKLIFVKKEEIFELDTESETMSTICKFNPPFSLQPT
jgi:hypothetical protein